MLQHCSHQCSKMFLTALSRHQARQCIVILQTRSLCHLTSSARSRTRRMTSWTSGLWSAYPEQSCHASLVLPLHRTNSYCIHNILLQSTIGLHSTALHNKQYRKCSTAAKKTGSFDEQSVKDIILHLETNTPDFSVIEKEATDLVSFLIHKKVNPEQIKSLLMDKRKLILEPLEVWERAFMTLKDLGFHSDQLLPAVVKIPAVIEGNLQKLIRTMDTLRAIGFREKQISKMILSHPGLLDQSPKKLIHQYNMLLKLYNKAGVVHTLLRTPSLFTEPFEELERRHLYVKDVMRADDVDMTRTNFLRHDLLHIYSRHQFLLRAGRYSMPNKHGETMFKNPTLKDILDSSDRYFTGKVARMKLLEYRTFVKICALEMNYGKGIESIDDDDDDVGDDYDDEETDDEGDENRT